MNYNILKEYLAYAEANNITPTFKGLKEYKEDLEDEKNINS